MSKWFRYTVEHGKGCWVFCPVGVVGELFSSKRKAEIERRNGCSDSGWFCRVVKLVEFGEGGKS